MATWAAAAAALGRQSQSIDQAIHHGVPHDDNQHQRMHMHTLACCSVFHIQTVQGKWRTLGWGYQVGSKTWGFGKQLGTYPWARWAGRTRGTALSLWARWAGGTAVTLGALGTLKFTVKSGTELQRFEY